MGRTKRRISVRSKLVAGTTGVLLVVIAAGIWYLADANFQVLNPAGQVASAERRLFIIAGIMSIGVAVPVFILLFGFAWRYREGNPKAIYQPDRDGSRILETVWWIIPGVLIGVLSVITWRSTHQLDPYRALASTQAPLKVQVVALQWKWLFLYPEQHVASVNSLQLPTGRPIEFELTSDAPMNSFWIPQLGGQIYTMPGMTTKLYLQADRAGVYDGRSANLSGEGFAGMTFKATAGSAADFEAWANNARTGTNRLDDPAYRSLAQPSQHVPPMVYRLTDTYLFDKTVNKYMATSPGVSV